MAIGLYKQASMASIRTLIHPSACDNLGAWAIGISGNAYACNLQFAFISAYRFDPKDNKPIYAANRLTRFYCADAYHTCGWHINNIPFDLFLAYYLGKTTNMRNNAY
jgi:hypothetical protein